METTAVPAVERINAETIIQPNAPVNPKVTGEGIVKPREAQPAQNQEPLPQPGSAKFPDVGLRFMIDPKSKEVTVLMVDRETKRVVRTIPPGELTKLKVGDLVDMFY